MHHEILNPGLPARSFAVDTPNRRWFQRGDGDMPVVRHSVHLDGSLRRALRSPALRESSTGADNRYRLQRDEAERHL